MSFHVWKYTLLRKEYDFQKDKNYRVWNVISNKIKITKYSLKMRTSLRVVLSFRYLPEYIISNLCSTDCKNFVDQENLSEGNYS